MGIWVSPSSQLDPNPSAGSKQDWGSPYPNSKGQGPSGMNTPAHLEPVALLPP